MPTIETVGIFSKPNVPAAVHLVPRVVEWLGARGIRTRCDHDTCVYLGQSGGFDRRDVPEGCDLVMVMGGDGTLLSAARAISGREIPLFAVNLGGLGFLTAITKEELFPELERALRGEHRIGKRKLLHVTVMRAGSAVTAYEALNDVVITKSSIARMIDLEAYVDDMFVCAYKADGLIVSTPTGSTAYSLSAGGPIIYPTVGAVCITPICPHTLTNRPLIVNSSSVIGVVCRAEDSSGFLTIDGQVGEPLHENDLIECRTSEFYLHLVRPPQQKFFDVLRQKLKWGER
ncbi:MAG: NAD(+)/NADH kinase [Acidobacteriota bacterium]|nr:NAD(+)/NADH kinase [Acidobacteriota bacterium]